MNIKFLVSLVSCLLLSITIFASNPTKTAILHYVQIHHEMAVQEMKKSGIPASILLAEAILLSEQGSSAMAVENNNHFAIKCGHAWSGEAVFKNEEGSITASCYRAYTNAADSYHDYTELMMEDRTCRALFQHSYYDYKSWAEGIGECLHADEESYAKRLVSLINKYDLSKYDTPEKFSPVVQKPIIGYEFEIN